MRRITTLAAIFFCALFLSACGGSDTIVSEVVQDAVDDTADNAGASEDDSDESSSDVDDSDQGTDGAQGTVEDPADEASAPEPTDVPATETAPDTAEDTAVETDTATAEDTAVETDTATDETATGVTVAEVLDSDDWCSAAVLVEDNFDSLEFVDFADPVALETAYTEVGQLLVATREFVPGPIAGDLDTTINGFGVLNDALAAAEWSFLDMDLSIMDELDAEMSLASYNIEKYNFESCGIGQDPGAPPAIETPGPDDIEFDGTIREQAVDELLGSGFTQVEAECVVAGIDPTAVEAAEDLSLILELFDECGIPLERLAELGG